MSSAAGMTRASTARSPRERPTAAAACRPVTTAFSVLHDAWPVRSTQSPHAYTPSPRRTPGERAAEPSAKEDVDPERAKAVAKACLVLGTEGQGLSDDALRACKPVAIPMSGEMESLNVGIAGGVLMYLMQATTKTR